MAYHEKGPWRLGQKQSRLQKEAGEHGWDDLSFDFYRDLPAVADLYPAETGHIHVNEGQLPGGRQERKDRYSNKTAGNRRKFVFPKKAMTPGTLPGKTQ